MLEMEQVHTYYGLSHILFGLTLAVEHKEVVSLLGRNGSGKTTTMRSVMGLTPPRSGRVRFKEEELAGKPPWVIATKGIGFVPEDRRIFPELTVRENLEVAIKPSGNRTRWTVERIYDLFKKLRELDGRKGGHLSGGEQQMLAISRTLMGNPELLLLDEPMEGLAPLIVKMLEDQIKGLRREGLTILLTEQNVRSAIKVSDRCYVIDKGTVHFQGSIDEFEANEEIRRTYLGV